MSSVEPEDPPQPPVPDPHGLAGMFTLTAEAEVIPGPPAAPDDTPEEDR